MNSSVFIKYKEFRKRIVFLSVQYLPEIDFLTCYMDLNNCISGCTYSFTYIYMKSIYVFDLAEATFCKEMKKGVHSQI